MRVLLRSALLCAAGIAATAALTGAAMAQAASGDPDKAALDFVQSYAAVSPSLHQYARWNDPICVEVSGLSPGKAAAIKGRIEEVAKGVDVQIAPAGCGHNIEVVFTAKPQAFIDDIARKQEVLLGYEHRSSKALRTVTQPIQAWYMTSTIGDGGASNSSLFAITGISGPTGYGDLPTQTHGRVIDDPNNWKPTGCGGSVFTACLKSALSNALIVVDTGRANKASVGVISDFVAMVALSQPSALGHCNTLPSITDLFADCGGRPAPTELTAADAAFLTALYGSDPQASHIRAEADIANRMGKILANSRTASR